MKKILLLVTLSGVVALTACERKTDTVHTSETIHTTEKVLVPVSAPSSEGEKVDSGAAVPQPDTGTAEKTFPADESPASSSSSAPSDTITN